jgi:hypothetical protein
VIRQYLLPLQFQSERQQGQVDNNMYGLSSNSSYEVYGQSSNMIPVAAPNHYPPLQAQIPGPPNPQQQIPNQFSGQPSMIMPPSPSNAFNMQQVPQGFNNNVPLPNPNLSVNPPTVYPSISQPPGIPPPAPGINNNSPSHQQSAMSVNVNNTSSTNRTIQPGT